MKMNILKSKGITGLSKIKATYLDPDLHDNFSEEALAIVAQIDPRGRGNPGTIPEHYRPSSKEKSLSKRLSGWLPLKLSCY